MIGRICSVFPGHTLFDCLNMTPEQLRSLYWECPIREARDKLNLLSVLQIPKMKPETARDLIEQIERQANPPDPDSDGEFTGEDINRLKIFFAGRGVRVG